MPPTPNSPTAVEKVYNFQLMATQKKLKKTATAALMP